MDQVSPEPPPAHPQSRSLGGVRRFLTRKGSSPASDTDRPPTGLRNRARTQITQVRNFAGTTPGSRLVLMTAVSVAIGILFAGVLLPLVGGFGLIAKAGATSFEELPSELKNPVLGERTTVLAADGSVLASFYNAGSSRNAGSNRTVVPLDQISPLIQQALIATEDSRFYDHGGIDLKGTLRAFVSSSDGEVQGGSTLTQQYVKNILMEDALQRGDEKAYNAAQLRSKDKEGYARKLRELRYAAELEKEQSKDQILNGYLNIAYFGNGAYGIETAANRYFSKPAKDLDLRESALLAGFVQNPTRFDPFTNPDEAKNRRGVVLSRMSELGMITPEVARETQTMDLGLHRNQEQSGCETVEFSAFCDWVRREMSTNPIFGATPEDRLDNLFDGGLTIKTTLDPRMQRAGQTALSNHVFPDDEVVGTLVTIEPGTGYIRAMANSRKFGSVGKFETKINYAGDIETGGSNGFQPGSTFKIFTSTAALEQGFGLRHLINSPYRVSIPDVKRCPGFGPVENYHPPEGFTPKNATEDESSTYDMRQAFGKSINTYYLQLQAQLDGGICPIAKLLDKLDVKKANDLQPLNQYSSFSIGDNSVSPTSLVAAYAMFPARGMFCNATAITAVLDRHGQPMEVPDNNCRQVISPDIADAINEMAQINFRPRPGDNYIPGIKAKLADGRPQAGKTGTHETKTLWYVGYTPNLVTGMGAYKPNAVTEDSQIIHNNETIGGKTPGELGARMWYGGTLNLPIFKEAMDVMTQGLPPLPFHPMDPRYEYGTRDVGAPLAPEAPPVPGSSPTPTTPGAGTGSSNSSTPGASTTGTPSGKPTTGTSTSPSTRPTPSTPSSSTTTRRGRPTTTATSP